MIFRVIATNQLRGKVFLPASKSYSIRAFIASALGGESEIIRPSDCDDAVVASQAAKALGATIKRSKDNHWLIQADLAKKIPENINVKESGTSLRLILPLLCLREQLIKVDGEGTLIGRPNLFLLKTLRDMGINIRGTGENESIPITIQGGHMQGGKISIDGSVSSQFISALLMTLPLLKEDSQLKLVGKIVSQDYIAMTLIILKQCGIRIVKKDDRTYFIKGNQIYKGLSKFIVPSDDGLAAFLLASAALVKSDLTFHGEFNSNFIQADGQIYDLLTLMDVKYRKTSKGITIKGPFRLKGGRFSLKNCPDLVPIMAVLALFAEGTTYLCDIAHARVKESDRISDLRHELLKIGAMVKETKDQLVITPKSSYKNDCVLDPHHDHRLAMAFCVLGLKVGVRVKDIECTHKSYPAFIKDFKSIGAKVLLNKK
ncbi:MAG: 3-phosphoshikimate 1-carboxyvinyltransferase [Candidatus Omnitrophica bacterium]|nr:3-phosphoshikimate 1-carboxyvinyltransferase [Candidatus Omnitrophota bacterium]